MPVDRAVIRENASFPVQWRCNRLVSIFSPLWRGYLSPLPVCFLCLRAEPRLFLSILLVSPSPDHEACKGCRIFSSHKVGNKNGHFSCKSSVVKAVVRNVFFLKKDRDIHVRVSVSCMLHAYRKNGEESQPEEILQIESPSVCQSRNLETFTFASFSPQEILVEEPSSPSFAESGPASNSVNIRLPLSSRLGFLLSHALLVQDLR